MGQSININLVSFFLLVLLLPSLSLAGMIVGEELVYVVRKGDTLELVGARTGGNWWKIAKDNNIDASRRLQLGQQLKVNTRRIIPATIENGIIINVPDRTLYYFRGGQLTRSFPIGLGMLSSKTGKDWKTPLGKFKVIAKEKNPIWYVPPSIQEEMEMDGKEVKITVPPGPDNPLGRYALKTTMPGIMIHETIRPSSVYQFRSHGCMRVQAENMVKFFEEVELNTPGEVIYRPVKAAVSEKGRVFLEVHRDFYKLEKNPEEEARKQLEKTGAIHIIDWQKVQKVLKERSGTAEDVSL
ncbi:MAG: LysM peptidoglycan-binding domain-containing protein [Nitrospirae bacterium]|nr:LysM peptidoglycan-binding domain-containing protein [Nitrospirota bacterium]